MALTADIAKKLEGQQARWDAFKTLVRTNYPPEVYQNLLGVATTQQWYQFLDKYKYNFDPQVFPAPVAAKPETPQEQTTPTQEEGFMAGFQSAAGGGGGVHVHTPEFIDEDYDYHKIAEDAQTEWLKEKGQKDFATKAGQDFLYGSLDDPTQPSLEEIASKRFREKFPKKAEAYDKLHEEIKKVIKKKPEDDNAFIRAHEKVKREFEARKKLLDEQAKKELIQLNQAALDERNKQLLEKIETKEWKKFAADYQEKALAYAPQHAGISNAVKELGITPAPTSPTVIKQKRQNDGFIDNFNNIANQLHDPKEFFKKIFFGGGGAAPAAETAIAGGEAALAAGEGIAAASEIAAIGEGALAAEAGASGTAGALAGGGTAAAATTVAAGEAAAAGTTITAAGGAVAAGGAGVGAAAAGSATTGAAVVAGGTATATVAWPVIVIVIIVLLIIFLILFLVVLFAVIGGAAKGGESNNNNQTTTAAETPIPGLTLNLDGPNEVQNSTNITYIIKALYNGALDITISDPLPSNTTLVSATGVYTQVNNAIRWDLKDNVSATGTGSGVLKDYSFTLVLNPTNPDILVKNKIIATSQSSLTGNIKELFAGNDQPLSGRGLALKGQIDSLLRQYPGNIAVYKEAEKATGVPWQVLAGLHYVEGTMESDRSLVSGRFISKNEPDVVRGGGCAPNNEPGKPRPMDGGCGFATLLDTAIYAGNHLKGKINKNIATFEDAVTAMSRYNGGGNRNCAQPGDVSPRTPWTGCPRLFLGEDDPYVLNNFDTRHEKMYLVYCKDLTLCNPPQLFGERLGSLTVAKIVAESGN